MIALSALPVEEENGEYSTLLGLPPEEGGFQNDPVLGVVDNLGIEGTALTALQIYVGVLAATILVVATNAGVIGASRITYAMASYRQLPGVFRRLHRALPDAVALARRLRRHRLDPDPAPGRDDVPRHDVLVRRDAVVHDRARRRDRPALPPAHGRARVPGAARTCASAASTGRSSRSSAASRPPSPGWSSWCRRTPRAGRASPGSPVGFVVYAVYRRFWVREPLRAVVRAPALILGPSLTVEYRTIVVPVVRSAESEEALVAAARLASERGSRVAVIHVLEVPLDLPIDAPLPEREAAANELLDDAEAMVGSYGLHVVTRLVRARSAGRAIVEEAQHRDAELVVLGAPRRRLYGQAKRAVFGRTVDQVLKGSPARVLVAAGSRAA